MNERIKELRYQAINYCMNKDSLGNLSEEVAEKFAELIVRRCLDIVNQEALSTGHVSAEMNQHATERLKSAFEKIEQHFGVE